jgi:histidinol-phosphatase (PHP family)
MWSNFHTHSTYCDGKASLKDSVEAGRSRLRCLGFSSHAPIPFDCSWTMKKQALDPYILEINSLKKSNPEMEIYAGLEVDYVPGVTGPRHFQHQLDYTIGSVHFADALPDGTPWEVDGPHVKFLEGLEKIFNNKIKDAVTRYYELTRHLLEDEPPTLLGHLDKIKIQNTGHPLFDESETWYREEIKETIDTIKRSGTIVEVNTRGLYQKKSDTPYPSPWILEILFQKKIPVTLSSDAHHPDDLVNQFPETAALLKKIGFKKLSVLSQGEWKALDFNETGILEH